MREYLKFYIDGQWVDPVRPNPFDVENPATEQVSGKISLGSAADVDVAVNAARRAFASWSQTTREQRLDLLQAILAEYQKRADDLAEAVTEEIGAPPSLAAGPQVFLGIGHLTTAIDVLKNFPFEEHKGATPDRQGADRCLRVDHAVELADQPGRGQGLPGVGDRLHRHPETL